VLGGTIGIGARRRLTWRWPTLPFVLAVWVLVPIAAAVMVGPADLRVRRAHGLLTCLALRTGACLCLYDPEAMVGGMVHITHGEPGELHPNRPGKYAPSGIDALIQAMERTGAFRNRLVAVIVGGAEVTVKDDEDDPQPLIIDAGVCRAVQLELERNGIKLINKEVGGKADRSVILDIAKGTVRVRSQNKEKTLCDLGNEPERAMVA
jgi:chemotaxis protein CheD